MFEDGVEHYDQMVVRKEIPVYSDCEHHMAPIIGRCTIARRASMVSKRLLAITRTARMIRPAGGGRNADTDWKGKRRSNDTHESSTDLDARLFKKSKKSPAILCYHGQILMEHRSGLVVGALVSHADGFAERASALRLLDCVPGTHAKTVGADMAYDTRDFVSDCRARNVTPHVARNDERSGGSAIDGRTSRHAGYRISQVIRKPIEENFGWGKTVDRIRQTVYSGIRRVDQHFKLTMVASNLTRMARMQGVVPQGALQ